MTPELSVMGLDIGSVTVGLALLDGAGRVRHKGYALHHGKIAQVAADLLGKLHPDQLTYLAVTSSTPANVKAQRRYDDQIAAIAAARHFHPGLGGLLVVGGEKFSLATFDEAGNYQGSTSNTSCAAGTGSFLDQQAGRLHLRGSEHLAAIAAGSQGQCPQIASRCAVFAKTDLIHAQQQGYRLDEIGNGLCLGLAKNLVDVLFAGNRSLHGELVFCGGVSRNRAVADHIERLTGLSLTIPADGHLYGAIGAALLFLEELRQGKDRPEPLRCEAPEELFRETEKTARTYHYPPLTLQLSTYPDFAGKERYTTRQEADGPEVEVDIYVDLSSKAVGEVYLGIDIGSTSTKAVLLDPEDDEVIAGFYTRTAGRPLAAVQNIFFEIGRASCRERV